MRLAATPSKNWYVANPPKLEQAAVEATIRPQRRLTPGRCHPTGNLWVKIVVWYLKNRYFK
jgi:hypothetical protein